MWAAGRKHPPAPAPRRPRVRAVHACASQVFIFSLNDVLFQRVHPRHQHASRCRRPHPCHPLRGPPPTGSPRARRTCGRTPHPCYPLLCSARIFSACVRPTRGSRRTLLVQEATWTSSAGAWKLRPRWKRAPRKLCTGLHRTMMPSCFAGCAVPVVSPVRELTWFRRWVCFAASRRRVSTKVCPL